MAVIYYIAHTVARDVIGRINTLDSVRDRQNKEQLRMMEKRLTTKIAALHLTEVQRAAIYHDSD